MTELLDKQATAQNDRSNWMVMGSTCITNIAEERTSQSSTRSSVSSDDIEDPEASQKECPDKH